MDIEIPREIEDRYEGRWIAWDLVSSQVVGDGGTLDEAIQASDSVWEAGHELYFHHILPRDAVIVGGL